MKLTNISDAAYARPGVYRGPCPECNRGLRDDAVSVTVYGRGNFVWYCHRCSSAQRSDGDSEHAAGPPSGLAPWVSALWNSTQALGGEARAYLRARNCVIPPIDSDLRWLPNLKHPTGYTGPALIGLITDAISGDPMSIYRTWILADGTKAPIQPPRLLAKGHRKKGGVIRLWPDDSVTSGLACGEGIETCLSMAHAYTPVWCCIDAGNLGGLPVLPGVDSLLIAADGEQTGIDAAWACASRWLNAGCEVTIVESPPGQDLNDVAVAT